MSLLATTGRGQGGTATTRWLIPVPKRDPIVPHQIVIWQNLLTSFDRFRGMNSSEK